MTQQTGPMEFVYDAERYKIEFERHRVPKQARDPLVDNVFHVILSTHPNTTVNLLEFDKVSKTFKLFRTWTVGCWKKDPFTLEKGRVGALRGISQGNSLPKGLKAAMWACYHSRSGGKIEGRPKIKVEQEPK